MKKFLVIVYTIVLLFGCAGMQTIETACRDRYPMTEITDPNVATLVESITAEGNKLLGAGTDVNNDWLLWFDVKGECIAVLASPADRRIMAFESCEKALDVWCQCLEQDVGCFDPSENI
jgi:hypothetical protein